APTGAPAALGPPAGHPGPVGPAPGAKAAVVRRLLAGRCLPVEYPFLAARRLATRFAAQLARWHPSIPHPSIPPMVAPGARPLGSRHHSAGKTNPWTRRPPLAPQTGRPGAPRTAFLATPCGFRTSGTTLSLPAKNRNVWFPALLSV